MSRPRLVLAFVLAFLFAVPSAGAVEIGIADSDADTFSGADWADLGVNRARAVVPWDVELTPRSPAAEARRNSFRAWVTAATQAGALPLVSFGPGDGGRSPTPPTPERFREGVRAFLAAYPAVTEIAPFNEPNFRSSEPAGQLDDDPERAAQFLLETVGACAEVGQDRCTVVAGDFAGIPGDDAYVDRYQAALGGYVPEVWSFHAHTDANRFQVGSDNSAPATRWALSQLTGPYAGAKLWIAEEGAWWRNTQNTVFGDASQARTVSLILGLAAIDPRIERIYYYNLRNLCDGPASRPCPVGDRGLTAPDHPSYADRGRRRPAYDVIRNRGPVISPSPAPPTGVSATVDGAVVRVAWPAVAPVDSPVSYSVFRRASGATEFVRVATVAETSWSDPAPPDVDAPASYRITAANTAGEQLESPPSAAVSYGSDVTAPETSITLAPDALVASRDATISFASSEAASGFECRIDEAAFAPCASPAGYTGLADGQHTFAVRAIDAAGNTDPTEAAVSWTVDATAPETTLTAAPPAATRSTQAVFAFSSPEEGVTFSCRLDATAARPCPAGGRFRGLREGTHTLRVAATDLAGNVEPVAALHRWRVDRTAPRTTVAARPPRGRPASPRPGVVFAASERGSSFECRLDNGRWRPCAPRAPFADLADGVHTVRARATDPAGNRDPRGASARFAVAGRPLAFARRQSRAGAAAGSLEVIFGCSRRCTARLALSAPRGRGGKPVGLGRSTLRLGRRDRDRLTLRLGATARRILRRNAGEPVRVTARGVLRETRRPPRVVSAAVTLR